MIDSYCRDSFQRWCVDPLASRLRLAPASITALSLLFGLACAFCIFWQQRLAALCLLALSGYCDVLDGSVARFRKMSSPLGATLDLMSDRAVEFALLFALFLVDPSERAVAAMILFGSIYLCIASFFSVSIFTEGKSEKSFVYSPGFIERSETFIIFALMLIAPFAFVWIAYAYSAAVFLTSLLRLWEFSRQVGSQVTRGQ